MPPVQNDDDNAKPEVLDGGVHLSMSDEEFLNSPPPGGVAAVSTDDSELPDPTNEEVLPADAVVETLPTPQTGDGADAGTASKTEPVEGEKKPETVAEDKPAVVADAPKEGDPVTPAEDQAAVNFEAEYKRLLAPFKANGRDIQVKGVDDAIVLMQMGANYNKKMAALKPNLKLMKMLENHNLLSEDKIGFLIDLGNKNPAAINKLVKESGIDPMDLSAEQASAYKQTAYTVDDREIELDTVLDELQGTPSYNRTLEIVSTKWDAASKSVVAKTPQLLKVINDHVSSGIYDRITKEIENERTFGRLVGLSDIEAYRQIGDALQERGGFNDLAQGSSQTQAKPVAAPVVVQPKPKQVDDDELKNKKRAASSTKAVVSSSANPDFNPLALSDDEFSKLVNKKFL